MKKNIHPNWYPNAKVVCACGNNFTTGSTVPEIKVEICAMCHPVFTGQQKFIDTLGRVDLFQKKAQQSKTKQAEIKQRAEQKKAKTEVKKDKQSLKDLLMLARKQATS